jgi:hypothetical protein
MGQLSETQRKHVTPRRAGERVILHASLAGQLRKQMTGNGVADLAQQSEPILRWLLLLAFAGALSRLPSLTLKRDMLNSGGVRSTT